MTLEVSQSGCCFKASGETEFAKSNRHTRSPPVLTLPGDTQRILHYVSYKTHWTIYYSLLFWGDGWGIPPFLCLPGSLFASAEGGSKDSFLKGRSTTYNSHGKHERSVHFSCNHRVPCFIQRQSFLRTV